jgi:2'-hydroxyisoflavone reductase
MSSSSPPALLARIRSRIRRPGQHPTWVAADFRESHYPDADIPIWVPSHGDEAAFASTSAARALNAGLTITPIAKTVSATLAWQLSRPENERAHPKAGLGTDLERQILAVWRARFQGGPAKLGHRHCFWTTTLPCAFTNT